MDRQHFYVTLPCDSSLNFYPDNEPSSFKVKLAKPLHLRGEWEVGLSALTYTHSFSNVWEGKTSVWYSEGTPTNFIRRYDVSKGYYKTGKDLLDEIRRGMNELGRRNISMRIHPITRKCLIDFSNKAHCNLNGHLAGLLGFPGVEMLTVEKSMKSILPVDVNRHMHAFYIYTDLIEPSLVGHDYVPLLRICEVPHKKVGEVEYKDYTLPEYYPLKCKDVETIEMNINWSTGEKVHFEGGTVIVKLHFRKRAPVL